MASGNDELGVKVGYKFESEKEVMPKVKSVLDSISKNTNIEVHFGVNKNELDKILDNTAKINKTNIQLDQDGKVLQSITEINTGLNQTLKLIENTKGTKINISNDYAKNEQLAYNESLKLLQQEYQIKTQLLTAEGKYKDVLNEQLLLNQRIQKVTTNDTTANKLLSEKVSLNEKYQQSVARVNDEKNKQVEKDKLEQAEMQRLINLEKQRLNNKIELYKNRYKGNEDVKALNETSNAVKNLGKSSTNLSELRKEFKSVSQEIQNMETKTKISTNNISKHDDMSFINNLKANITSLSSYLIGGSFLYSIGNTFREAVEYVVELDSAMVSLKKVTDETDGVYKEFLNTAHDLAMEFGSQSNKVVEATTSWAKTGKSLKDATELAKSTMLLTKVGDIENVDTAQQFMIAPLKAFNIEANKSIELIDKYNNLSNNMATDTKDLGEAFSQSASMLSTAGNDINQSLALIATAESNTKLGGSTIGNALKTISLRIAEFKDEDGQLIPKFEENMKSLGVTMRDSEGQIKSTFDILMEASAKFKEFNKNQQLALSQELGGKRQANVVSAILNDAEGLQRAYQLAQESSGSAMEEFSKYQDSIQYSLDRLKEQMNGLFTNLVNSDFLKGVTEVGVTILNTINSITQAFGTLPAILTVAGTAFFMFNKNAKEMVDYMTQDLMGIGKFKTSLSSLETSLTQQISKIKSTIEVEKGLNVAYKEAGLSVNGLGTSLLGLNTKLALTEIKLLGVKFATVALQSIISFGLSFAISSVIGLLGKFVSGLKDVENASESLSSTKQKIKELQDATSNVNNMNVSLGQYSEIKKQLEDTNLTVEERNALEEKCTQIKQSILAIDSDAGSILDNNNLTLETQVGLLKEMVKLKQQEKADDMEKEMSKGSIFGSKSTEEMNIDESVKVMDYYIEKYKEVMALQKESQGKDIKIDGNTYNLEQQNKLLDEYSSKIKDQYTEVQLHNSKVQSIIDANGECSISFKNLSDDVTNFANGLLGADDKLSQSADETQTHINTLSNSMDSQPSIDKTEEIKTALINLGYTSDEISDKLKDMNLENGLASSDVITDATKRFGEMTSSIQNAYEMIEKLNEAGSMTPQLMSELASKYPEMGSSIFDVSTAQDYLNGKINDMQDIQSTAMKIMRGNDESYYQELLSNGDSLQNAVNQWASNFVDINSDSYKINVNDFKTLNEAKAGISSQLTRAMAEMIAGWANDDASKYEFDLNGFTTLAQQKTYVLQKLDNQIAKVQENYNNLISSTAHKAGNRLIEATKGLNNKMLSDRLNLQINGLSSMMEEDLNSLKAKRQQIETSFAEFNRGFGRTSANFSAGDYLSGSSGKGSGSKGGSGSKSAEKQVEDIENLTDRYYEYNNAITKVENSLKLLSTQEENANGEEKKRLINEKIALYNKQRQALQDLLDEKEREKQDYRNQLYSQGGFTFYGDDTITNYKERMEALKNYANSFSDPDEKKNAQEYYKNLAKMVEEYTNLINKSIPDTKNQIENIKNEIISSQKEISSVMEKQVSDFKDMLNKRYDAVKKEQDKEKELMNRKWDEEDKKDDIAEKQRKLNELKAELQQALRTGDESLIKNIQLQIAEAQKELNKYINQSERDLANQAFEDEQNRLDDELQAKLDMIEEKLGDEDILKLVQSGITDLSDTLNNIDSTTHMVNTSFMNVADTVMNIGDTIGTSWIANLDKVNLKIKDMASTMTNSITFGAVMPVVENTTMPSFQGKQDINLNVEGFGDVIINGKSDDEIESAIMKELNERDKRLVHQIMNMLKR